MVENGHTGRLGQISGLYPNANGMGSNSLAMVQPLFHSDLQQYAYIPGLSNDDPKGLVLMYLRARTRYACHGDTEHTIFSPRRWMVLPPEIIPGTGTYPEGGELLDTPEFKKRLQTTLAFLRENQRPYWQAVADEQSAFLNSLKD